MAATVGLRGRPVKSIGELEAQRPGARHWECAVVRDGPWLSGHDGAVTPGLGVATRVAGPRREIATGERDRSGARPEGGRHGGPRGKRPGHPPALDVPGLL